MTDNIFINIYILIKNKMIRWSFWLLTIAAMYVIYSNSQMMQSDSQNNLFARQLMLFDIVFGVIAVILVGSFLGAADNIYQTKYIRLLYNSRIRIMISKIITVMLISTITTGILYLIGKMYDVISDGNVLPETYDVKAVIYVFLYNIFFGVLAMTIALITGSYNNGAAVVVIYLFAERYFAEYIPVEVLKYLPVWNMQNIGNSVFSIKEGLFSIVMKYSVDVRYSVLVITVYFLIFTALMIYKYINVE